MIKRLSVLLILMTGLLQAAQLIHTRYESIVKDQPLIFNLEVRDVILASVDSVVLYYKGDVDGGYSKIEMSATALGHYIANIVPVLNDAVQFQYYFAVNMMDGSKFTLPEIFPEDNAFFADIKRSETDPRLRLLNPVNKGIIAESQPVMLVSFEDIYGILDLSTISLKVDGKDVTKESNIVNHFVSYVPPTPLAEDNHQIEFHVADNKGQDYTVQSSFLYRSKTPSFIDWKGTETLQIDTYGSDVSPNTRPGLKIRNTVEMNLKSGFVNADVYDYETSEESALAQRQSRQRLTLYDDAGFVRVSLKDSSPVLSLYSLNGINVDGISSVFSIPGFMSFTYVKGASQRAINGDSNPSVNRNGTFLQNVDAVQLAIKSDASNIIAMLTHPLLFPVIAVQTLANIKTGGWDFAANYLHMMDDKTSLGTSANWGSTLPQDNIVVGFVDKFYFTEDQSAYSKAELAGSLYYADISAADLNAVPSQAASALPGFLLDFVPKHAQLPASGFAGNNEIGFPVFSKELSMKLYDRYASIGFKDLGNPSIKNDDLMGGASVKLNLLRGALSFSGAYDAGRDNFLGILQTSTSNTNFSTEIKGMANVDVFGLANLGYNYNSSLKTSDASPTSSTYVKNNTLTNLFSLTNIRLELDKFVGKLNTNYSVINYVDDVSSQNNFDQTALGYSVDTEFSPIKARFSLSTSKKDAKGTTPNSTAYNSYGLRLDYDYIPKILTTYGSVQLQTGANNGADPTKWIDTNKTTLGLGAVYRYPSKFFIFYDTKFYVDISLTAASDKLAASADRSKNYSEQSLVFKLTTTF